MSLKFLFRLLISVGVLAAILVRADMGALGSYLGKVSGSYVPGILGLGIGQVLLTSMRWHLMLRAVGVRLPRRVTLEANVLSILGNSLLVNVVGGMMVRVGMLRVHGVPSGKVVSTSLLERLQVAAVLLVMTIGGVFWFHADLRLAVSSDDFRRIAALALVAVPLAALVFYGTNEVIRQQFRRVADYLRNVVHDLRAMVLDYRSLAGALGYTVASQLCIIGMAVLIGRAIGLPMSPVDLAMVLPLVALLSSLPVSLSGFGVREFSLVLILPMFGVPGEAALALGLLIGLFALSSALLSQLAVSLLRSARDGAG
ncbi:MAG: lysylphosphatidylglycerol synthase transmembrane domain-containing protein [Magnetospirillum sp.]|nr:lysylphosphatidylglycerol synthase transmembrane domain-containing protein [Magnetospirillum sp.]